MFNNLFNPIYPVIFNPPFMQNRTGYGLERLLLCQTNKSENKIYGSYVTPEEFSMQSKIPLKFVKEHLSGEIRFFGHLNYISFLLNKRIKIKLID